MDIYEYIGNQIRSLRELNRQNQETLATAIDVSTNTISRWETGTYKISIKDLQKVADYFKVGLSSLLPPEEVETNRTALLSATGGLPQEDIDELIRYADYRRARKLLDRKKSPKE